jgi:Pyridoxamine 5'-phosphate oxidase
MSFSDEEIAYLQSQPLTRLATVGPDGQPDVVPLAYEFDGRGFWVGESATPSPEPASSATLPPATIASP